MRQIIVIAVGLQNALLRIFTYMDMHWINEKRIIVGNKSLQMSPKLVYVLDNIMYVFET